MVRMILASGLLGLSLCVQADELLLNDVRGQGGVQLSAEELRQLMPNAKVVSHFEESVRRWTNEADGKFVASSDIRRHRLGATASHTGRGTWHVGDNGTYCVTIDWAKRSENWCRSVVSG